MFSGLANVSKMSIFWFGIDQILLFAVQVGLFLGALWLFRRQVLRVLIRSPVPLCANLGPGL